MDRREDIIDELDGVSDGWHTRYDAGEVKKAMDEYMRECVLLAFEFVAHETTGHSYNKTKDELEFKYKGEWISKEKLFENFL